MSTSQNVRSLIHTFVWLSAGALAVACGDDSKSGRHTHEESDAGALDAGDAASSEDGEDAGESPDGGDEPEQPEPRRVMVATTDYAATEVFFFDLDNKRVLGEGLPIADGDVSLQASAGLTFAIERTNDALLVFEDGEQRVFQGASGPFSRIDLGAAIEFEAGLNPQSVVVLPGQDRALVSLYGKPAIAVVDLALGTVHSSIDLSSLHDASDEDGSPDAAEGIYDPESKLVYFVLQRIDLSGFPFYCGSRRSLVIAIDPATLSVVDLNGAAEGKAIELTLNNPTSLLLDEVKSRLVILASGCTNSETEARAEHGIEALDLKTRESTVLYAASEEDYHTGLQLLSGSRYLLSGYDAAWSSVHAIWDESSKTVGESLADVPAGAFADGGDTLLGVRAVEDTVGSGYAIDSYSLSSAASTELVRNAAAKDFFGVSGLVKLP